MMKIVFDPDAEYISESQKGIKYVNERLTTKKTVYSEAVIQRIPHNDANHDEICLKIGRYKINGQVETDVPKSELTLSNEEFEKLIAFIQKFYKPMELGISSFVPLNDSQSAELLQRFKAITKNNKEKAKMIIDSGILEKDISLALVQFQREECINDFKKNIDLDNNEQFWQEWFENNKWILGSEFSKILDERNIDLDNIADYIVKSLDGFVDLIEIKKPNGMDFWSSTKDHGNYVPSSSLIKAITQCQNYVYAIEGEINSVKFSKKVEGTPVARPTCLLVFGRSNDWDEEKYLAYRLLNSSLNQITVVTYDQLLKRAEKMIGLDNQD